MSSPPEFAATKPAPDKMGSFDLIKRFSLPYAREITLEKWVSRETGLTVFWADYPSPLLNSFVILATEIFNDSGCPHTLEHLVFLGSEKYPYKGILDTLANRAFARGTNAWTATDHTAYTLTTAGSDGFLRMLPIYSDHIFFPTLTKPGFTTEVYHVDGQAKEAGVVFSEMQGRENTSGDLMEVARNRLLFPEDSAYRSETGGMMANLRKLNVNAIREYHHIYYAPHNAAIVLTGSLDREQLFAQLRTVDQSFVDHGLDHGPTGPPGWKRPFLETKSARVPKIAPEKDNRQVLDVPFPDKDESMGELEMNWITPPMTDWLTNQALDLLGTYLSDSPIAPLNKEFVERSDPKFTSVFVGCEVYASWTATSLFLNSVAVKDLDTLDVDVVRFLSDLASKADINLERMRTEIQREKLRTLEQLESGPQDFISDVVVTDFMYGERSGKDLLEIRNDMERLDILDKWTAQQWADLIKTYLVDNPRLVVTARPSAKMASELRAESKAALKERKERFGEEGLKRLGKELDEARRANDAPIPEKVISDFPIPSPLTINWIPLGVGRALPSPQAGIPSLGPDLNQLDKDVQVHVDQDPTQLPFFVQFDHFNSAFVTISLVFNTSQLPAELYPYLSLFKRTLFALPVERQDGTGQTLSKDELIEKLNVDTLMYFSTSGYYGVFQETLNVEIRAEASKYPIIIAWLRDILAGAQFDPSDLEISLRKQLQSLPEMKRSGRRVLTSVFQEMTLDPNKASSLHTSIFAQSKDVPAQLALLKPSETDQGPAQPEKVVEALKQLRSHLLQPKNVCAHVSGDILSLQAPKKDWADAKFGLPSWWSPGKWDLATLPIDPMKKVQNKLGSAPAYEVTVCSVPAIESSFAVFTAKGLSDYNHPDVPALTVAVGLLNALEGFLWRLIRGAGLAYGASLSFTPDNGYVGLSLFRSPNSADAYLEARRLLRALGGDTSAQRPGEKLEIDLAMVQSAKSSLVYDVAEERCSGLSSAQKTFVESVLQGAGKDYGRQLLAQMESVTVEDVQRAIRTYLVPIFDPAQSIGAVAASPEAAGKVKEQLAQAGYHVTLRELATDDVDGEEGSGTGSEEDGSDGSGESGSSEGSEESDEE